MEAARLPGTPDEVDERIVLHVDMDCFYASCERLREPELEGEPVVVGMGYEPGETNGAVATASYEAREHGVESAQPISQALEQLPRMEADVKDEQSDPRGYYRSVDLEFYRSVAADVKAVLHDCADVVREVSIDEAYLDVTDRTGWDPVPGGDPSRSAGPAETRRLAEGYARHVIERIQREAGVPASVGVAPNMSTAKIASDFDKPNGLTVVPPGHVRSFLSPLSTAEIHGVGPVTARELSELGIETAGDLAAADPTELEARFGQRGRELYARARGDDDREVTPTGRPKSLSRESAFAEPVREVAPKRETVRALAADVADRARSREALYRTIGIKAVEPPFEVNTRAESLSGPVDDPELLEEIALELLEEFHETRVRKLGVRVSNLSFEAGDQATLGGFEDAEIEATGPADGNGSVGPRERSTDERSSSRPSRFRRGVDQSALDEWTRDEEARNEEPRDEEARNG
ncbi:DNA polymerase IV [Halalkaliarchaeum desulfuricum]|uniref:DNA polymerase IV n=1 Tax=Halalkaliarchaeum desulfuricum TaxID=2055893 RepID=A0A343TGC7_9EURY|nr:DNA polymerase IV [Halalkaliarchaeum desulfuricum]AUX08149.1 DNA polymerase IV [Halalkaliarchaeum desulfuricum]